jgi:uncharacterized damage-inducible protein DinB
VTAVIEDAFRHHTWATGRLLETCADLPDAQLAATVAGIYGTIRDTVRHMVGSDAWYLFVITGGRVPRIDEETMDMTSLRAAAERHAGEWHALARSQPDPDEDVVAHHGDGTESHARMGIRLAQVLHHGTDHRSQVCTALTTLGIEPPDIDVWAYAESVGRVGDGPLEN